MIEQEVAFYKIKPSDVIHINEVIITTMPQNLTDCVFQSWGLISINYLDLKFNLLKLNDWISSIV